MEDTGKGAGDGFPVCISSYIPQRDGRRDVAAAVRLFSRADKKKDFLVFLNQSV